MAVTVENIATEAGRSTPPTTSVDYRQWSTWIGDATRTIEIAAERRGKIVADLNENDVDYVVRKMVASWVANPDGVESFTRSTQVDDAQVSLTRRFAAQPDAGLSDEWLARLFGVESSNRSHVGALRIGTPPHRVPWP